MGIAGVAGVIGGGALAATGVGVGPGLALAAGGTALLHNDRNRAAINPFGQKGYNDLLNAQQGTDTQDIWSSLRAQNPNKGAALDRYQSRYATDLNSQRMMGLNDDQMSAFQSSAGMEGFTPDQAGQMAGQIQGAGGSTRGMRGLSTLGLQAQRQFDLTNAGSVLGKISGGAGSDKASEQVFRRLMEESIKAGLDKSDFREEQRRFADVSAEILSKAGISTASDAAKDLQGFSKYIGDSPTMRGMGAAQSSYQEAQDFSAETSGRGGALQFAGMMKDPVLKQLGTRGTAALSEVPLEDISSTNPLIVASAVKAGVSAEDLADRLRKVKTGTSYNAIGLNQNKVQSMDKMLSSQGITGTASEGQLNALKSQSSDTFDTYYDTITAPSVRNKYGGVQKTESDFLGLRRGDYQGGAGQGYYKDQLYSSTGRSGDIANSGVAAGMQAMTENFRANRDAILPNTAAILELSRNILGLINKPNESQANATARYMNTVPLKQQTQGGKPVSK
jgi:hypothetical protein